MMISDKIKIRLKKYKILVEIHRILLGIRMLLRSHRRIPGKDLLNPKKLLLFIRVFPYTQINYTRLSNNYELAKEIEQNNIDGSFVECGVWRGGSAAVLASLARDDRDVWLFDSFSGMPKTKISVDREVLKEGDNIASEEEVKHLFRKLHLDKENINIIKGWFEDTLPNYKDRIGKISILRLDADFYESTKTCLDNLFNNVVLGGYVIVDDYFSFMGCKKAVDEFIKQHNLKVNMIQLDDSGGYFKK